MQNIVVICICFQIEDLTTFIKKKTKWDVILVMVENVPVVWFKTEQSTSKPPHLFDSVVMSFDQEALGMG